MQISALSDSQVCLEEEEEEKEQETNTQITAVFQSCSLSHVYLISKIYTNNNF